MDQLQYVLILHQQLVPNHLLIFHFQKIDVLFLMLYYPAELSIFCKEKNYQLLPYKIELLADYNLSLIHI